MFRHSLLRLFFICVCSIFLGNEALAWEDCPGIKGSRFIEEGSRSRPLSSSFWVIPIKSNYVYVDKIKTTKMLASNGYTFKNKPRMICENRFYPDGGSYSSSPPRCLNTINGNLFESDYDSIDTPIKMILPDKSGMLTSVKAHESQYLVRAVDCKEKLRYEFILLTLMGLLDQKLPYLLLERKQYNIIVENVVSPSL